MMKEKKKIPWSEKTVRQKAASVGIVTGCFLGAGVLAYAASTYYSHKSFTIDNTKGAMFSMDLSGSVEAVEVVPGTEQTVSPCIENKGTEPMYVFVRFDVGTTASGGNVYSFTPENDSGWSQVEAPAGQLLYVY